MGKSSSKQKASREGASSKPESKSVGSMSVISLAQDSTMDAYTPTEEDETLTREAIRKMRAELARETDLDAILDDLYSKEIISEEQFDSLQTYQKSEGRIYAVGRLLDLVIGKDIRVHGFMAVLKGKLDWVYKKIQDGVNKFKSGEWTPPENRVFKVIQDHLKKHYRQSLFQLKPIPGEDYTVPLEDMMTADFTAHQVDLESKKNIEKIKAFQRLDDTMASYKDIKISDFEDTFNSLGNVQLKVKNLQPNLMTLIGDPGVGKTTVTQNLAWRWAKGTGKLSEKYKLIFFLPIRHVREGSLLEVLSALKLFPDNFSDKDQFINLINKPENASQILFILDGADENDIPDDVLSLVRGKSFHGTTVLMTARPEAKCLKSLTIMSKVKVNLLGTNNDTVYRWMKKSVSPSSETEWNEFQDNYKEKLTDMSLLRIPLYLTLLCAVFKENIANGLKCAKLRIPASSTELFNTFIHVIITRWLARTPRHKKQSLEFKNSPLGNNGNVPGHIKRSLYFIGKLCYNDLIQPTSNYEFTDTQARDCFLDMQDVKDSGLFTVAKSGASEMFFLRHKQLQEYLAALYLACEGTKEPFLQGIINIEANKGHSLAYVMRDANLMKLLQFTCGLSAEFFKSLFTITASQFSLLTHITGQIDIYYESALFIEQHAGDLCSAANADSLSGFKELKDYLYNSNTHTVHDKEFNFLISSQSQTEQLGFYQKCLQKLTRLFDRDLSLGLLFKFYNIKLTPVNSPLGTDYKLHSEGGMSSSSSNIDLCLDQLQAELLSGVCIHGVQSVRSSAQNTLTSPSTLLTPSTIYVDVPGLLGIFTDITTLDVGGRIYIPYTIRPERDISTSLASVQLKSSAPIPLPESHVQALFNQPRLSQVDLCCVSIFPVLCNSPHLRQSLWSSLKILTLWEGFTKQPTSEVSVLHDLLHSSSNTLQKCQLVVFNVYPDSVPQIGETLKSLTQLNTLGLCLCDTSDNPVYTTEVLTHCLSHLTKLHTLEVSIDTHEHQIEPLRVALGSLKGSLESLTITSFSESDCTYQVLVHSLSALTKLRKLGIRNVFIHRDQIEPLSVALGSLEELKILELYITIDRSDLSGYLLLKTLPKLTNVYDLSIDYDMIKSSQEALLKTLCNQTSVRKLGVWGDRDEFPTDLLQRLEQWGVEVELKEANQIPMFSA